MNAGRRWLLAVAVVAVGASMSLAIACSSDNNDNNDNNTPAPTQMQETPSGTMADETPSETAMAGETPGETMAANEVHIAETEYSITGLDGPIPSPAGGDITFEVHNDGTIQHSFYVIKSDLDPASLPLDGTKVDENATGVDVVDEIDDFDAGTIKTLSVNLEAGHYVLICNIAGHYSQGMHAAFDVM